MSESDARVGPRAGFGGDLCRLTRRPAIRFVGALLLNTFERLHLGPSLRIIFLVVIDKIRERDATFISRAHLARDLSPLINQNSWLKGRSAVPFPAHANLYSIQPWKVTNDLWSTPETNPYQTDLHMRRVLPWTPMQIDTR